jgi:hypothetical protein
MAMSQHHHSICIKVLSLFTKNWYAQNPTWCTLLYTPMLQGDWRRMILNIHKYTWLKKPIKHMSCTNLYRQVYYVQISCQSTTSCNLMTAIKSIKLQMSSAPVKKLSRLLYKIQTVSTLDDLRAASEVVNLLLRMPSFLLSHHSTLLIGNLPCLCLLLSSPLCDTCTL